MLVRIAIAFSLQKYGPLYFSTARGASKDRPVPQLLLSNMGWHMEKDKQIKYPFV
jgi:hypothetical protein